MGTKLLPPATAYLLKNRQLKVVVWLDPDPAGRNASAEIRRQLGMMGIRAEDIVTNADPKFHSKQEIRDVLGHFSVANDEGPKGLRQAYPSGELAIIGTTDSSDTH
jgi:DNA primase